MKDVLMANQIAALKKAGFFSEEMIKGYLSVKEDKKAELVKIKGISDKSANAILEQLGYEV
jgi:endonuclease III-like uncharacterized protein